MESIVYIILFFVVLLIIFLLMWIIKGGVFSGSGHNGGSKDSARKNNGKSNGDSNSGNAAGVLLAICPLCNSRLQKGENLITKVYRPMTVSDQLCTIDGCPHCFPIVQPGLHRECPVCHKKVPLYSGHLIARLFNKTDTKKHVIVTGCTECSRGAR